MSDTGRTASNTGYVIIGYVEGSVAFPDRPDWDGSLGLVGGEDVCAERRTFRSTNEAARWVKNVLDGTIKPRWTPFGELLVKYVGPRWGDGYVIVQDRYGNELHRWWTSDGVTWK